MDACEASTFSTAVDWYRGRGYWFSPPLVQVIDGVPKISTTNPDPPGGEWTASFETLSEIYDVEKRLQTPLAKTYRQHIDETLEKLVGSGRRFGALVMEPVCLGAGGMAFVDPLFQRCLIDCVRDSKLFGPDGEGWHGLPVIFDEGECSVPGPMKTNICSVQRSSQAFVSDSHEHPGCRARYQRQCQDPHWRSASSQHDDGFFIDLRILPLRS